VKWKCCVKWSWYVKWGVFEVEVLCGVKMCEGCM